MGISRFSSSIYIAKATVIGPHHEKNNLPNQDACDVYNSEGLVALAVADGLGSAKFSEQGSKEAVKIALSNLKEYLCCQGDKTDKIQNIHHLKEITVSSWKNKFGSAVADYDTTLLFVGLTPNKCVMGQIGDGLILYQASRHSDQCTTFSASQRDYLNTPDATLAQPNALEKFQIVEYDVTPEEEYNNFLLMTDGVADDLSDTERYFNDLKRELLQHSPQQWEDRLRQHLTNWQTPGHYDDKTLIIAISKNQTEMSHTQNAELQTTVKIPEEATGIASDSTASSAITMKGKDEVNG